MAELLVRTVDAPVPNSPGKHHRGYVAVVMPDGHVWGRKEGPPTFAIIKLPGVSVPAAQDLLLETEEEETPSGRKRLVSRRTRGITNAILNQVGEDGVLTLPGITDSLLSTISERV